MFTGIVTDQGRIVALEPADKGVRLTVETSYDVSTIAIGASVAHNGICMTVVETSPVHGNLKGSYVVEAWNETLQVTTLNDWKVGDLVNLERALRVGDELGGHMVSGHVDGVAEVVSATAEGEGVRYVIRARHDLARLIAPKGSVALNGTSLTVNGVNGDEFDVLIIRHTREVTSWGRTVAGDRINLEVDTMARYLARYISTQ